MITNNDLEQAAKRADKVRNAEAAHAHGPSQCDQAKHDELVREFGDAIGAYMELVQRLANRHANG